MAFCGTYNSCHYNTNKISGSRSVGWLYKKERNVLCVWALSIWAWAFVSGQLSELPANGRPSLPAGLLLLFHLSLALRGHVVDLLHSLVSSLLLQEQFALSQTQVCPLLYSILFHRIQSLRAHLLGRLRRRSAHCQHGLDQLRTGTYSNCLHYFSKMLSWICVHCWTTDNSFFMIQVSPKL